MLMVLQAGPNILEFVHTLVFSKFNGRKCNNWTNERIMFDLRRNTVGKKYRVKKESEIRSNFNHENDEIRTYLTLVAFFINPGHIEHRILWKPIALLFRVWFSVLFAFAVCHHCFHCNAIRYRYVHTNMYKTFFMVSLYKKNRRNDAMSRAAQAIATNSNLWCYFGWKRWTRELGCIATHTHSHTDI